MTPPTTQAGKGFNGHIHGQSVHIEVGENKVEASNNVEVDTDEVKILN